MQISSTQLNKQQFPKAVSAQASEAAPASQEPTDSFTFSGGSLSGKEKLQTATVAVAGGIIGAIPVAGAVSGFIAAAVNGPEDELGAIIGMASLVTNAAASAAIGLGGYSPFLLAVPAVLGAISWGGCAYNKAAG